MLGGGGAFSSAGLPGEAVALTGFVLTGTTLLRPLVNWVNRLPITIGVTQTTSSLGPQVLASRLGVDGLPEVKGHLNPDEEKLRFSS